MFHIHSFIHSFIHSIYSSFIHSIYSFIHPSIHPSTHLLWMLHFLTIDSVIKWSVVLAFNFIIATGAKKQKIQVKTVPGDEEDDMPVVLMKWTAVQEDGSVWSLCCCQQSVQFKGVVPEPKSLSCKWCQLDTMVVYTPAVCATAACISMFQI